MTQGEHLSLQVSTHSEGTSEGQQQRKQDGHHCFGSLHGRARKFNGIKADGVFGRDTGREGVIGALGVYRAAFTTMEQTAPLTRKKVQVPVVALGGERAQGLQIRKMVEMVAENVDGGSIADCGHFVPEERPDEILRHVLAMTEKLATQ